MHLEEGTQSADEGGYGVVAIGQTGTYLHLLFDHDTGAEITRFGLRVGAGGTITWCDVPEWQDVRDAALANDRTAFDTAADAAWSSYANGSSDYRDAAWLAAKGVAVLAVGVRLRYHLGATELPSDPLAAGDGAAILGALGTQAAFDTAVATTDAATWYGTSPQTGSTERAGLRRACQDLVS